MKKFLLFSFLLVAVSQASAQTCTVWDTVFTADGLTPAGKGIEIILHRAEKAGVLIIASPIRYFTNRNGLFSFKVVQGANAWIQAPIAGFRTAGGVAVAIPASDSVRLSTLQSLGLIKTAGLLVRDDGVDVDLVDSLDFINNFTVTAIGNQRAKVALNNDFGEPAYFFNAAGDSFWIDLGNANSINSDHLLQFQNDSTSLNKTIITRSGDEIFLPSTATPANIDTAIMNYSTINLPSGKFYLSNSVVIDISNRNNFRLQGAGIRKTIVQRDSSDNFVAQFVNCDTLIIEGVTFKGGKVLIDSCNYVILRNIESTHSGGNGFLIRYSSNVSIESSYASYNRYHGFEINNAQGGIFLSRCVSQFNGSKGFEIWEGSTDLNPSKYVNILQCFSNNNDMGVIVHHSNYNIIANNIFTEDSVFSVQLTDTSRYNLITGNIFISSVAGHTSGIDVASMSAQNIIYGNSFIGTTDSVTTSGGGTAIGQIGNGSFYLYKTIYSALGATDSISIDKDGLKTDFNTSDIKKDVLTLQKPTQGSGLFLALRNGVGKTTDWRIGAMNDGSGHRIVFYYADGAVSSASSPGNKKAAFWNDGSQILAGSAPVFAVTTTGTNKVYETVSQATDSAGIILNGATQTISPVGIDGDAYDIGISTSDEALFQNASGGWKFTTGGIVAGTPTGGNKGNGTINASAVYDDNVILTDYVFEPEYRLQSIDSMAFFFKQNKHLPTIPGRDEWESSGKFSVGKLATRLWETVEVQARYIAELNERLRKLEKEK